MSEGRFLFPSNAKGDNSVITLSNDATQNPNFSASNVNCHHGAPLRPQQMRPPPLNDGTTYLMAGFLMGFAGEKRPRGSAFEIDEPKILRRRRRSGDNMLMTCEILGSEKMCLQRCCVSHKTRKIVLKNTDMPELRTTDMERSCFMFIPPWMIPHDHEWFLLITKGCMTS